MDIAEEKSQDPERYSLIVGQVPNRTKSGLGVRTRDLVPSNGLQ
jgi:hypothetical protein